MKDEKQKKTIESAALDDKELDGVTGGFDLPHGDRDDKNPYAHDPKHWLRPHKER